MPSWLVTHSRPAARIAASIGGSGAAARQDTLASAAASHMNARRRAFAIESLPQLTALPRAFNT
jgi:hypothetical protein